MMDSTSSSEPGRELAVLGRLDDAGCIGETMTWWSGEFWSRPSRRKNAERPRVARSRSRAREIVESII
jgi:hypothetical protein